MFSIGIKHPVYGFQATVAGRKKVRMVVNFLLLYKPT